MHPRLLLFAALLLLAAACGGDDEPATTTEPPATSAPITPTSQVPTTLAIASDPFKGEAAGGPSEFCRLVAEVNTGSFDFGMQPEELATAFETMLDVVHRSEELAPPEGRADVAVLVAAFEGFDQMLAEFNYDPLTVGPEDQNDPRLLVFQTPEFASAVDNIALLCGLTVARSGEGGSDLPAEDPGVTAGIPAGFPALLVPPSFTGAYDLGEGAVLFVTAATFGDLVDHYSSTIGPPGVVDDVEGAALWAVPMLDGEAIVSVAIREQGVDVLVVTP